MDRGAWKLAIHVPELSRARTMTRLLRSYEFHL
uniref:Uncharacterized protein n=1 Tax=Arundo donax TaxID=35708 RepID=A0A0A9E2I4_ARUDO